MKTGPRIRLSSFSRLGECALNASEHTTAKDSGAKLARQKNRRRNCPFAGVSFTARLIGTSIKSSQRKSALTYSRLWRGGGSGKE